MHRSRGADRPSLLTRLVLHPVLFALYPVLHLYSVNADQTDFRTALPPLLLFPLLSALLWGLLSLLTRSPRRAALMASTAVLLFFSYGHVHYFAYNYLAFFEGDAGSVHGGPLAVETRLTWALSGLWLLLLALGLYAATRPKEPALATATRVLNSLAVLLLAMPLITLAAGGLPGAGEQEERHGRRVQGGTVRQGEDRFRPDIYYIILDGYARADILERHYAFDNSPFLDALRQRGFHVANESWANYTWTFLSLSSTLNMKHVVEYREINGPKSTNRELAYREIRDNEVVRFLRDRGYRYVHLSSTWGATLHNPFADMEISCAAGVFRNELYRAIGESSWLKAWSARVGGDLARCHLANLESLTRLASMAGPKFVLAHFIPPHHPYLFDRDGNILRHATVSNQFEFRKRLWRLKPRYIDQLVFMNGRIGEVVDAILGRSAAPPVIILHSDHGPHVPGRDRQRARLANLSAFHLPRAEAEDLVPHDLHSVNLFVRLLNHYFDAGLELQPRKHYVSPFKRPYAFREVETPR